MAVGVEADQWLEDRTGHLKGEGDQAHLGEIESERLFDQRIDRGNQRLDCIVEQVRAAQGDQDRQDGLLFGRRAMRLSTVNRIRPKRLGGIFCSPYHG